jgi:hypothetical protein
MSDLTHTCSFAKCSKKSVVLTYSKIVSSSPYIYRIVSQYNNFENLLIYVHKNTILNCVKNFESDLTFPGRDILRCSR